MSVTTDGSTLSTIERRAPAGSGRWRRVSRLGRGIATGAVAACLLGPCSMAAARSGGLTVNHADTYKIAQEDGPGSINQTDTRWGVYGADLGSMFMYHDQIRMAFGDSFGGPAAYRSSRWPTRITATT